MDFKKDLEELAAQLNSQGSHEGAALVTSAVNALAAPQQAVAASSEPVEQVQVYMNRGRKGWEVSGRVPDNTSLRPGLNTLYSASANQPIQAKALTDERAAFEHNVAIRSPGCDLSRNHIDAYNNRYVQHDWEGWQARALLASQPSAQLSVTQESRDLVDWDRISEAAKQACNEYGQWMPERWLQLFVNAYSRNKS